MDCLPEGYSYRPLPDGLYIGYSEIEGNGLFTSKTIVAYSELGITHIRVGNELIRTPLGGFINHSTTPNCIITNFNRCDQPNDWLMTTRYIKEGEELTANYFLSSCGKETLVEGK